MALLSVFLFVSLLVAGTPPARPSSSTSGCSDNELVSFNPWIQYISSDWPSIQCCDNFAAAVDDNTAFCPAPSPVPWISYISSSPINISDWPSIQCCDNFAAAVDDNTAFCLTPSPVPWISSSPSIQCCDNFAAVFDDNAEICLYYLVHNPPILNSTKLTSVCPVKDKEGQESFSLERVSLCSGYHDNPAPQDPGSSLPPSSDDDDKPSAASQATQSASSSTTYCQWLLYAALVFFVANRRGRVYPLEFPIIDEDDGGFENELGGGDDGEEQPRLVNVYRQIENEDNLVATVDITGCFGFTSFSEAVKASHPEGNDDDWNECVLWPWRGERMEYLAEDDVVLNPLESTWIDFSQLLNRIRVTEQDDEPSIGMVFRDVSQGFDVLLPRRYVDDSRSFAIALHYIWSAWNTVEPFAFDQIEEADITPTAHISYFDIFGIVLLPPPAPANLEGWDQFIHTLSYITIASGPRQS